MTYSQWQMLALGGFFGGIVVLIAGLATNSMPAVATGGMMIVLGVAINHWQHF